MRFAARREKSEKETCSTGMCVCFLIRVERRHAKNIPTLVWRLLAGKFTEFRVVLMEVEVPHFMPYLLRINELTGDDPRIVVSPQLPLRKTYGFEQLNNELDELVQEGKCSHFVLTSGDYLYAHSFLERLIEPMQTTPEFIQCEYVSRSNRFGVTKDAPLLGVTVFSREIVQLNPDIRFRYQNLSQGYLISTFSHCKIANNIKLNPIIYLYLYHSSSHHSSLL